MNTNEDDKSFLRELKDSRVGRLVRGSGEVAMMLALSWGTFAPHESGMFSAETQESIAASHVLNQRNG